MGWTRTVTGTEAGESESGRRRRLDSGAVLDVRGDRAYVECSVPKRVTGVNFPALSVAEVVEALPWIVSEASEFVGFVEPLEGLSVNRLDVVRDFDCGDGLRVAAVLSALGSVPGRGRATRAHFLDATANRAQTVRVATRTAGGGTLYDKGRESGIVSAGGVLRFEARERQATLRPGGIATVSDLTAARAERLGRERFTWAQFDAQMLGNQDWFDRVLGASASTYEALMLLGYGEVLRRLGSVGQMFPAMRSDQRWRKAIRGIGVPASATMRLDYSEGLVMAA